MIRAVALLAATFLGSHLTSAQLLPKRVQLTVAETAGVARNGEIVTSGVPFPLGQVPRPENVRIFDPSGTEVPTLVTVRAVWPDKTVKWATIQFACSLPPNGSRIYQLECGSGVHQKPASPNQIAAAKGFFLTAPPTRGVKLEVDGKPLEQAVVSGAERTHKETKLDSAGPVIAKSRTDYADWVSQTFASVFSLTAQTRGGVGGKSQATVYTLRHVSEKASLPVTGWEMILLDRAEIKAVTFGGDRSGHRFAVSSTTKLELLQKSAVSYVINSSGKAVASGFRAPGWITVETTDGSTTFTVRNFWQQFPLAIQVDAKRVVLRPWASDKPFAFDQGLAKSFDILTAEGPKGATGEALNRVFQSPLYAVCSPEWVAATGVLGNVRSANFSSNPELETLIEAGANRWSSRYGARVWGSSYAAPSATASASDEAGGLLTQFLRTGKLRHLESGLLGAIYAADSGVNHFNGQPWRMEQDGRKIPSPLSHISVDGLLLFTELTGDSRGIDTAREVGLYVTRAVRKRSEASGEANLGQALQVLSSVYMSTGDEKFIESARTVADLLLTDLGHDGTFKVRGAANTPSTKGQAVVGLMAFSKAANDLKSAQAAGQVAVSLLNGKPDISGRALSAVCCIDGIASGAWVKEAQSSSIEANLNGVSPGESKYVIPPSTSKSTDGRSSARILIGLTSDAKPVWLIKDKEGTALTFTSIAMGGNGKMTFTSVPGSAADINGKLIGAIESSRAVIEVTGTVGPANQSSVKLKPAGRSAVWRAFGQLDGASIWSLFTSRPMPNMLYSNDVKVVSGLGPRIWFTTTGGLATFTVEAAGDNSCIATVSNSTGRTLSAYEGIERGNLKFNVPPNESGPLCLELVGCKVVSMEGIAPYFGSDRESMFNVSHPFANIIQPPVSSRTRTRR